MSTVLDEPRAEVAAPPKIHAAIIAIMRAVGPVAKDQRNEQQKFNYRGVDQIYNACHPKFAEHGVYSTSDIIHAEHREGKSGNGKTFLHAIIQMRYTFWAEDGSSVHTEVIGEGLDYSGDKASNKAMSIASKYALLQLLQIPVAMVDPDNGTAGNTPAQANGAPKAQPRGKRVTMSDVKGAYVKWRDSSKPEGTQSELFDKWQAFVFKATESEFNVRDAESWSYDSYMKVYRAIEGIAV